LIVEKLITEVVPLWYGAGDPKSMRPGAETGAKSL
jgi:hypothetical protein